MMLEVSPEEFAAIAEASSTLPDSLFAQWMIDNFGERCPDLRYGLPVKVRVRGKIEVAAHAGWAKVTGFTD